MQWHIHEFIIERISQLGEFIIRISTVYTSESSAIVV